MTSRQELLIRDYFYNVMWPHFEKIQTSQKIDAKLECRAAAEKLASNCARVFEFKKHETK